MHPFMSPVRKAYYFARHVLRNLFYRLCRLLDRVVPKQRGLILFASVHGERCSGNSRFLYEYCLKHRPDLECWFFFRRADVKDEVPSKLVPGWKAFWLFLRAEKLFNTHGPDDFHPYASSHKGKMVTFWHGVTMRGMGLLDWSRPADQRKLIVQSNRGNDLILAPSKEAAMRWCSCIGLGLDRVVYAGQPRNDFLLMGAKPELPASVGNLFSGGTRNILYAPTWRPNGPVRWFPFEDFDADELERFLEANDLRLLLRGHLTEKGSAGKFLSGRVVDFSQDVLGDVNVALPHIDGLITDYSSLLYDYLLLDRPVVFLHYDYDFYDDYYGFLFDDPDYWFPGPKPRTFREFKEALLSVQNGAPEHSEKRHSVNKSINNFQTNDSGKQILAALGL